MEVCEHNEPSSNRMEILHFPTRRLYSEGDQYCYAIPSRRYLPTSELDLLELHLVPIPASQAKS